MKTILVTGGTGFVGSNLCHRLIADGERVICLDNNYTGSPENVRDLMDNPRFTLVEHDVIEPYDCPEKLDRIYNLACPASPPFYQGNRSIFTTKTCVLGILNMLELAKKNGARILQSSTSEVYGEPQVHPQVESYRGNVNPIGIRACYDEGKRCAESLMFDYHRHEGVDIRVIRIFNTYGPMMNPEDGRVVSNFICQALRGDDITIYGEGQQTRSFQYVDDLIEGMVRMMENETGFVGPVNLGNPGSSPSASSRIWCWRRYPPRASWCTARCPPTTPPSAARKSPWLGKSSVGNPPSRFPRAWTAPSPTSGKKSASSTGKEKPPAGNGGPVFA